MRGVRDGVDVEWDISAVPAEGGLTASEAIASPEAGGERLESGDRLCWLRCAIPDLASSNGISVDRNRSCRFTIATAGSTRSS